MIFYFSASGNSYHVARRLSEALGENMVDMGKAIRNHAYTYTIAPKEKLGFVFPVHAWAPPKIIEDFVRRLELYFIDDLYVYAVCTCGQSAGESLSVLDACLRDNGLKLNSGYSVVMPDNYAVLFPAPQKAECNQILQDAEETIQLITRAIRLERREFFRVKKGKGSTFLSNVINPLFCRFATSTKPFYAENSCIGCGLCASVCPIGCIEMTNHKKPYWMDTHCTKCMACLQQCPVHAIQCGKNTLDKGRYLHPDYRR